MFGTPGVLVTVVTVLFVFFEAIFCSLRGMFNLVFSRTIIYLFIPAASVGCASTSHNTGVLQNNQDIESLCF